MKNKIKALIPVKDEKGNLKIYKNIENADYYILFDVDKGVYSSFSIDEILNKHDTDSLIEAVIAERITIIIAETMKVAAFNVLRKNGIKVYLPSGFDLDENTRKLKKGQLKLMSTENLAKLTGCLSGCSSCVSDCK